MVILQEGFAVKDEIRTRFHHMFRGGNGKRHSKYPSTDEGDLLPCAPFHLLIPCFVQSAQNTDFPTPAG